MQNCKIGGMWRVTSKLDQLGEVANCHNCGAAVSYHYCCVCGQETKLHVPSAAEFIHEFVGHYVALEGRLWKTLAALLFRPGFLTREYIEGRRVRYVEPLRVYLTFSILFFALLKVLDPVLFQDDARTPASQAVTVEAVQPAAADREETDLDLSKLGVSPEMERKLKAFGSLPREARDAKLTAALFSYVPYALFCLMPLFALYLKLLYLGTGRRYGEHLLFALHANGFAFAILGVLIVISPLDLGFIRFLLVAWMVAYLPMAMQRVYGGARALTGLRWTVLTVLHALSIGVALIATVGVAILR